jgi:hypothetical protein
MKHANLLREHAQAILKIAENTGGEDRACLHSVAREWLSIADKLERFDHKTIEPTPIVPADASTEA